jgi:hypothetical protein
METSDYEIDLAPAQTPDTSRPLQLRKVAIHEPSMAAVRDGRIEGFIPFVTTDTDNGSHGSCCV